MADQLSRSACSALSSARQAQPLADMHLHLEVAPCGCKEQRLAHTTPMLTRPTISSQNANDHKANDHKVTIGSHKANVHKANGWLTQGQRVRKHRAADDAHDARGLMTGQRLKWQKIAN